MIEKSGQPYRVLFVCLGNICRSPAAEAVMAHVLKQRGLEDAVTVDSAGTADYHIGRSSDERMIRAGARRRYSLTHRARQIQQADLQDFDVIFAMDKSNLRSIKQLTGKTELLAKVHLFLPYCGIEDIDEVPDPYYGGVEGFEQVLDLMEQGCAKLADLIESMLEQTSSIPDNM